MYVFIINEYFTLKSQIKKHQTDRLIPNNPKYHSFWQRLVCVCVCVCVCVSYHWLRASSCIPRPACPAIPPRDPRRTRRTPPANSSGRRYPSWLTPLSGHNVTEASQQEGHDLRSRFRPPWTAPPPSSTSRWGRRCPSLAPHTHTASFVHGKTATAKEKLDLTAWPAGREERSRTRARHSSQI